MTTINYYINQTNLLKLTISFLLIGIIGRSIAKTPTAAIELLLLTFLLISAIIYIAENYSISKRRTLFFSLFLSYLILHVLTVLIWRPFELNVPFFDAFYFIFSEFRISVMVYLLPLAFIPIEYSDIEKFERFLILILKIAIAYTILEQILSLGGLRESFAEFYSNAGIVTVGAGAPEITVKRFGLYRVWGLVGSPQLLGVFHIISLLFMLQKKETFWATASFIAIIFSTSKTAYLLLIIVGFLFLLQKRHFLSLIFFVIFTLFVSFGLWEFYLYLDDMNKIHLYPELYQFVGSIEGYFQLISYRKDPDDLFFVSGGALNSLTTYFQQNPLDLILGRGVTYSFMNIDALAQTPFISYDYLTSEFYFLSFFEQYGIIGILLLLIVFIYYPLKEILISKNNYYPYIPLIVLLSMLHYSPIVSKLMMIFTSYALWSIYFKKKENLDERV